MVLMETKILQESQVQEAADVIKSGGLVVFPTETVYGIGADAYNEDAVQKIFTAKGRPSDNPLIVHIYSYDQLNEVADMSHVDQDLVQKLCDTFWPGPLTLILPRQDRVPLATTAGLETVAVRMPKSLYARELIRQSGVPVAAPSANISGKPSGTCFEHVVQDLSGKVDVIVESDLCDIGIESTVVDMSTGTPALLRPGVITAEDLQQVLSSLTIVDDTDPEAKRSPGMKYTHYTPDAEIILFEGRTRENIADWQKKYEEQGKKVVVLHAEKSEAFMKNLFKFFRDADDNNIDYILISGTDDEGYGRAIMNRIRKAASQVIL